MFSWALFVALLHAMPSAHAQPAASIYRVEARALFGNCKAQADGPQSRYYTCPGLTASIGWMPDLANLSTSQLLDVMRMGFATVVQGELSSQPASLPLAGREYPALKLSVSDPVSKRVQHTGHMALDQQEGGAWIYMCLGNVNVPRAAKDCAKKLEFFAKQGVPEPVDLKSPPLPQKPQLFSRELVVPEGCRLERASADVGRILCPGSALAWYLVTPIPRMEKWLKESADAYRKQIQGDLREYAMRCTLEGAPADCMRLEGTDTGARLRMLIGVRQHEQHGVQVACISSGDTQELPAVCNGLLQVLPDGAPDAGSAPSPTARPDAGRR